MLVCCSFISNCLGEHVIHFLSTRWRFSVWSTKADFPILTILKHCRLYLFSLVWFLREIAAPCCYCSGLQIPNEKSRSNIRDQIDQQDIIAVGVFCAQALARFFARLFFVSFDRGALWCCVTYPAGMLAPPHPALRKNKGAPPRPTEIDKTRGAQRGKADCRFHRLCPHIWAKSGEMKEQLLFGLLYSLWLSGLQKDHLKVIECNVFLVQSTRL